MVRFYNLRPDQVQNLDAVTANQLWLAITTLEAREMINQIMVASYPHLEAEKRKDMMRSLERQAAVEDGPKKPEISNQDLNNWLMGALGGG